MGRKNNIRTAVFISFILIAAVLIVYARVRSCDFVNVDDDIYVYENPYIKTGLNLKSIQWAFTTNRVGQWIPLTWLSLMLDYELYGLNPAGYHATNLLFHIINVLLLFFIFFRMTGKVRQSAFVAGLFALHPLHVESVAWVTERKDVLSTFFWMLAIAAYIFYAEKPGIKRYLPVFAAFICGVLSKPMVVTLPFAALLLDFWPLNRLKKVKTSFLILEKLPLFAASFALSIINLASHYARGSLQTTESLPLFFRAGNALVSYVTYIMKMFIPVKLSVFYPHPGASLALWKSAGAGLILIAITLLFLRAARHHRYLIFGWLWYLGTIFPVIGFFQAGLQAMADRFVYIPFIGLYVIIAWGIPGAFGKRLNNKLIIPIAAWAALFACMILSFFQVSKWENSIILNEHAVSVTSNNFFSHTSLGNALAERGKFKEAADNYREAIQINPGYVRAYNNFGTIMFMQEQFPEAYGLFQRALKIDPEFADAHYNEGIIHISREQYKKAENHFREALRIKPDYSDAQFNLGVVMAIQRNFNEAIALFSGVLELDPANANVYKNMAMAYADQGRSDKAEKHYREALRLSPGNAEIHLKLADILSKRGKQSEAQKHYDEAQRINPKP